MVVHKVLRDDGQTVEVVACEHCRGFGRTPGTKIQCPRCGGRGHQPLEVAP